MAAMPARPAPPVGGARSPWTARGPRCDRRRRTLQGGQIIPLVALLLVVITGFAALVIDAGLSYGQSRTDQDASDAAALAASYWISANPTSSSVDGAYEAAANVAARDCTSPSASCRVALDFYTTSGYTGSPRTTECAVTFTAASPPPSSPAQSPSNCLAATAASNTTYAGTTVDNTANDYFANLLGGSRTHQIAPPEAIAQVANPGSGDGSGVTISCEICDLGTLSISAKDSGLYSTNGNIQINGAVTASAQDDCLYASSSGSCSSEGGTNYHIYFSTTPPTLNSKTTIYPAYSTDAAISDPMAGVAAPETSPAWGGLTDRGSYSSSGTCPTSAVPSGRYQNITLGVSGCNYTFSGDYMISGSMSVPVQNVTLSGTGVNFYFLCGSDSSPATCSSSGQSGGSFAVTASGVAIDLSAPTSGSMGNILFYFDPHDTAGLSITAQNMSSSGKATGALYMPDGKLAISASNSGVFLSPIVVGSIAISAQQAGVGYLNGSLSVASSPTPGGLVQ